MTTNLNQVEGDNRFCGPAAIASIAGVSTDEAAKIINLVRGSDREVKAVYLSHIILALEKLNYTCRRIQVLTGYRLFTFLETLNEDGHYLIMVPGHFVVVEKIGALRQFCDNHTKTPIRAASSARLMQKIFAAIKVDKR